MVFNLMYGCSACGDDNDFDSDSDSGEDFEDEEDEDSGEDFEGEGGDY